MLPFVNTVIDMPADVFEALVEYEFACIGMQASGRELPRPEMFLRQNFSPDVAARFRPEYVINTPETGAACP